LKKLFKDVVKDVRVFCNPEDISITLSTFGETFNGLIYPKGLSKISSCMKEYKQVVILPFETFNVKKV